MDEVKISPGDFKALSSESRIRIIKFLRERNHTLSELSARLGIAAPSTKQHLERLLKTGIINQLDEGRKWKYYSLTGKGRNIAGAEENQAAILIVMGFATICLVGVLFMMFGSMGAQAQPAGAVDKEFAAPEPQLAKAGVLERGGTAAAGEGAADRAGAEPEDGTAPAEAGKGTAGPEAGPTTAEAGQGAGFGAQAWLLAAIALVLVMGTLFEKWREKRKLLKSV